MVWVMWSNQIGLHRLARKSWEWLNDGRPSDGRRAGRFKSILDSEGRIALCLGTPVNCAAEVSGLKSIG
jgi:hypothetical protein